MKTVLVPTDFTRCAEQASRLAADIAEMADMELSFIHVLELPVSGKADFYLNQVLVKDMTRDAQQKLRKLTTKFENRVPVHTYLSVSSTMEGIQNAITGIHADLIVMGSHGKDSMRDQLLGTNTSHIIRFAQCPVITLNEYTKFRRFRRALVALDPESFNESALWELKGLQEIFGLDLNFLYIRQNDDYSKDSLELFLEAHMLKAGIESYHIDIVKGNGDTSDLILDYADRTSTDLIIAVTRGRSGLTKWISGSVTEDLIEKTTLPVITFRLTENISPPKHLMQMF
jgi:nucleotide-binding universal stress UspA family protein